MVFYFRIVQSLNKFNTHPNLKVMLLRTEEIKSLMSQYLVVTKSTVLFVYIQII